MNDKIWVLVDDRPGNYAQSLGLAEALAKILNYQVEIKKINYNFWAKLPNFLKIDDLSTIDQTSKDSLLNCLHPPQIVISAGRKSAVIASFLKKHYNAFVVQIMNPNLNFKQFDWVILPKHDKTTPVKNVINIIGAFTRINDDLLKTEYQKFADTLSIIKSPKIALLVGGSSKKGRFTTEAADNLSEIVNKVTKKMSAHLLILNSRRTNQVITNQLEKQLNNPKTFFKWQAGNWPNPYFAVLEAADYIIATGDSISMCSEICSLGKPVYIFNPPLLCSQKHLKFHQSLFASQLAKELDNNLEQLENYPTTKLDETNRVAKKIAEVFRYKKQT